MNTTQAKAAINRIKPGCILRENKRALSKAERDANVSKRQQHNVRVREIDSTLEQARFKGVQKQLSRAARCVVDADGSGLTIPELHRVLAIVEERESLLAERANLVRVRNELNTHSFRWALVETGGFCTIVHHQADTLEELVEMVKKNKG